MRRIGIRAVGDDETPLVRAQCIGIARRLHLSGNKVIGFLPAGHDMVAGPVLVQLGAAVSELTGAAVAVVDARARLSALDGLTGLVAGGEQPYALALVDLSGFDVRGEHMAAAAAMDAVVLLARAKKSRERDVLEYRDAIPRDRFMGVLLVG